MIEQWQWWVNFLAIVGLGVIALAERWSVRQSARQITDAELRKAFEDFRDLTSRRLDGLHAKASDYGNIQQALLTKLEVEIVRAAKDHERLFAHQAYLTTEIEDLRRRVNIHQGSEIR